MRSQLDLLRDALRDQRRVRLLYLGTSEWKRLYDVRVYRDG